jgi:hypothetical protein
MYLEDEPSQVEWQCPCPECNGYYGPRIDPSDENAMMEPEHPENIEPKPLSFWYYADTLKYS